MVSENQRFVVNKLGKFKGFVGPGLLFQWPWNSDFWLKVSVGDEAQLIRGDLAKLKEIEIPVITKGDAAVGNLVVVENFEEQVAVVSKSQRRTTIICEKCGHKNLI
jgi:regulator of protease activity HflC (stomatin/prohibitin superfamily)